MGFKACEGLRDLLKKNQILSQINFSDNAISNEGLKIIGSGTFTKDSQLVSIIMSNNELQGAAAIQCFSQMLSQSKAIQELDLSDNNLGDPGMEEIARIYQQNANRLMKITLKNIQATSVSVGKLFFALKGNNFLTQLNLENNDLSGSQFEQISLLLWNNKKLQKLELKNCSISNYGCECIGEGLGKNTTLRHLDLSNNKFSPPSLKKWADVLGRSALRYLDLSNNDLNDEGALYIVQGLSFGQSEEQKLPKLKFLGLKAVSMNNKGASALC